MTEPALQDGIPSAGDGDAPATPVRSGPGGPATAGEERFRVGTVVGLQPEEEEDGEDEERDEVHTPGSAGPPDFAPDGPLSHSPVPEELQSRIEAAIRLIDAPVAAGREDHVLAPLEHAQLYEQSAPELAERLRMSDVRITAESYVQRDQRANALRREFEKQAERARNAVLVSAIAAALLVASAGAASIPGLPSRALAGAVIALSIVAVVSGALAAGWIQAIRGSTLHERWMKRRAEAERERLHYFALLAHETRLSNPLLQLEYIRRYQLDVQRAFFDRRGDDHRSGADRQIMVIAFAAAAAGIAAGVAGVLGASLGGAWASIAALGLVAQAFAARAENRLATDQSVRNAERYEQTRVFLDELYRLLDRVRAATAAVGPGDEPAPMRQYVAAIHDRLAEEHRQWLDDTQLAGDAISRLEQMMEEAKRTARER